MDKQLVGTQHDASAKTKQTNFTKRHCAKNGHIEFSLLGRYIAPTGKNFFSNWENKSPQLDNYIEKKIFFDKRTKEQIKYGLRL